MKLSIEMQVYLIGYFSKPCLYSTAGVRIIAIFNFINFFPYQTFIPASPLRKNPILYKGYLHALFVLDIIRTCILRYIYVNPNPILPKNLLYDDE